MSNKKTTEKKVKIGRPSFGRTPKQKKEYLKQRSRTYYSNPDRKREQLEKMRLYREKHREKINAKKKSKDCPETI